MISKESKIGEGTVIWHKHLVNIYGNCVIGKNCNIGGFVEIGPGVVIGNNVRIGAHTFIPSGVTIGDNCFVGPGVIFTNDKYPPGPKEKWGKIVVEKGASIGAGCVILPNVIIRENALVGAGSVVVRNVPVGETVFGNPSRRQPDEY